jgi:SET domain-containing protein
MDSNPPMSNPGMLPPSPPRSGGEGRGEEALRVQGEIIPRPSTLDPLITAWIIFQPSPIHGTGGFARAEIPAGARIIEYTGEKITKSESLSRCEHSNEYIFGLDDEHDLDGNVPWNLARFLNHSCQPNCEALLEQGRIWMVSLRQIRAGEELTFNYGYDLEDYRQYPCSCGAPRCVGYIVAEEFFDLLRRRNPV